MKKCEYIKTEGNHIYSPRPTSWIGGWARDVWIRSKFPITQTISIASPKLWSSLCETYDVEVISDED